MKKGRRISLLIVAFALAILLTAVFWFREKEPKYQGKKLSQWVSLLDDPRPAEQSAQPQAAAEAIRALGTNAIPCLVRWIAYEPSASKRNTYRLLADLHFVSFNRNVQRLQARTANSVTAFRCLGRAGESAIPELNRIMTNAASSEDTSARARDSLAFIGEPAVPWLLTALTNHWRYRHQVPGTFAFMAMQGTDVKPAIPLLLALLKNADEATSESAARALGQLAEHQIETDAILPALIEATHDPRPKIRLQAVIALAGLGRHSRLVIPALVKSLGDSDFEVAMYATRYLGELRSQPDLVIPALVKGLEKRDLRSMRVQMAALARYGRQSRSAVPTLLDIMNTREIDSYSVAASNTVWQIAPEVLPK